MTGVPPTEDADDVDPRVRARTLHKRAVRFEQALADRFATRVEPTPYGVARFSPDNPLYHGGNAVEVTRPAAVSELLADVEARFGAHGLAHRRVHTAVPEVAWVLTPALVDRGWSAERLTYLAHDGRTAPTVSPIGVGPVDLAAWRPHSRAVTAGEPWGRAEAVQDAMAIKDQRLAEAVGATFVMSRDGAAGCHVYRHGAVAQIESVNVVADARGQGLGTAVMAAALQACGDATLCFLVADADDWPQRWYARLGFRPIGSAWAWSRT